MMMVKQSWAETLSFLKDFLRCKKKLVSSNIDTDDISGTISPTPITNSINQVDNIINNKRIQWYKVGGQFNVPRAFNWTGGAFI